MKRYLIIMTCIVFAIAAVVFAYDQAYFPKAMSQQTVDK